ncbi:hypothetical protein [Methanoregula sp. UBA64]|uniref:hypothetical protein n=1 Tax=Methanoregula sp. UBA64 TaxID=1915554 RepID=UPI0037428342
MKFLKQYRRYRNSDLYIMDKGYDSEESHELIQDTLNSCSLIPVRNRKRKRISGYYRRRLALLFADDKYHLVSFEEFYSANNLLIFLNRK